MGQTTDTSRTGDSDILVYPTYYHVTNLVELTDSTVHASKKMETFDNILHYMGKLTPPI